MSENGTIDPRPLIVPPPLADLENEILGPTVRMHFSFPEAKEILLKHIQARYLQAGTTVSKSNVDFSGYDVRVSFTLNNGEKA